MIEYEISRADMARVERKLNGLGKDAKKALKFAINDTAREARHKLAEGVQDAYTAKIGHIQSHLPIDWAKVSNLEATIRANDRPLTLKSFSHRGGKSKPGGAAAAADIVKEGLKEIISQINKNKAFKGPGGRIKGVIVQRDGKERSVLKVLHSNSVPKMIEKVYQGERGVNRAIKKTITEGLHRNIEAEIAKLT